MLGGHRALRCQPTAALTTPSLAPWLSPPLQDDFHALVDSARGFAWVNERPDATEKKAQKWGFVATAPGAALEFEVDSRGGAAGAGEPNRLVLSYLASYEGMGVGRVECVQVRLGGGWGAWDEEQRAGQHRESGGHLPAADGAVCIPLCPEPTGASATAPPAGPAGVHVRAQGH